mgnify:CR=1 FL=1
MGTGAAIGAIAAVPTVGGIAFASIAQVAAGSALPLASVGSTFASGVILPIATGTVVGGTVGYLAGKIVNKAGGVVWSYVQGTHEYLSGKYEKTATR